MKKTVLLLAFLLVAFPAFAQTAAYDVSCRRVARIRIIRVADTYWKIESDNGFFYVLDIELKRNS